MKLKDAEKITVGTCLRKRSRKYPKSRFKVMRVTSVNKQWHLWTVQSVVFNDGTMFAMEKECFDYAFSDGFEVVDCERDFLRLHMLLKMQQVTVKPIIERLSSDEIAQNTNVQIEELSFE